jgi:hypothetical protein
MAAPGKNEVDPFVYDIANHGHPSHPHRRRLQSHAQGNFGFDGNGSSGRHAEGDRLDILTTLVQAYEARHFPMATPDPVKAINFRPPG